MHMPYWNNDYRSGAGTGEVEYFCQAQFFDKNNLPVILKAQKINTNEYFIKARNNFIDFQAVQDLTGVQPRLMTSKTILNELPFLHTRSTLK